MKLLLPFVFLLIDPSTSENILDSCLLKILKKHFVNESVLMMADQTIHPEKRKPRLLPDLEKEYHEVIFSTVMKTLEWGIQIYNTDKFIGLPSQAKLERLKNTIFIICEKVASSEESLLRELGALKRSPLWNPAGRNLILVQADGSPFNNKNLSRIIIQELWSKSKGVNNLVMISKENEPIEFYTWFPYRQPDCAEVNRIVHLDTYGKKGFRKGRNLFPKKVRNDLHECELVIATDACIPYVFADPNNASNFVDGLEILILNTFKEKLNFRTRTVRPSNIWSTTENGTVVGAFKLLLEHKIDMAFSCLMLTAERNMLAMALPPYFKDTLSWFVPSPDMEYHKMDIFFSLSTNFWILMLATFASAIVPVVLWSYLEHGTGRLNLSFIINYIVKVIGLALWSPVELPARKIAFRLFVFLFCLYSLHVVIAFQSALFALYRKPNYNRFYQSLEEAVDAGLLVYLRRSAQDLYNQSNHELWNKILQPGRHGYIHDFGEAFSEIAYDKSAIALFIRSTGIYMISVYFTDEYGVPQIVWLRKSFAAYPVTMYLAPGHPLFQNLQFQVLRFVSSGLMRVWLFRSVLGGKLAWFPDTFSNTALSLMQLAGVFFILIILLGVAVVVFVLEIIVFNVLEKRKQRLVGKYHSKHLRRNLFVERLPKGNLMPVTIVRVENRNPTFPPVNY